MLCNFTVVFGRLKFFVRAQVVQNFGNQSLYFRLPMLLNVFSETIRKSNTNFKTCTTKQINTENCQVIWPTTIIQPGVLKMFTLKCTSGGYLLEELHAHVNSSRN